MRRPTGVAVAVVLWALTLGCSSASGPEAEPFESPARFDPPSDASTPGLAAAGPTAAEDRPPSGGSGWHGANYTNPVQDRDFPDPTVIRAVRGWYYVYGTQTVVNDDPVNVQVARSKDLVHWRYLGEALPSLPAWGDQAGVSWAPEVVHYRGRYHLYYSVVPDELIDDFGLCLAVATSRSPAGPFVTEDEPLYCGSTLADIDARVFRDPANGNGGFTGAPAATSSPPGSTTA